MGSLSIQKGKRAERQVANLLNPIIERVCQREGVDVQKLQRNLKQVQQGGFDLDGLDWIAIEIKHHKQPSLGSWWDQCCRQAVEGRLPVLIWKPHGGQWRVRMRGQLPLHDGTSIRCVTDMPDMSSFLVWFELELTHRIRGAIAKGDSAAVSEMIGAGGPSGSTSTEAPKLAIYESNPGDRTPDNRWVGPDIAIQGHAVTFLAVDEFDHGEPANQHGQDGYVPEHDPGDDGLDAYTPPWEQPA